MTLTLTFWLMTSVMFIIVGYWFHSWEIDGFLAHYFTHLMSVSACYSMNDTAWSAMAKCDISCFETKNLYKFLLTKHLESFYMAVNAPKDDKNAWLGSLQNVHRCGLQGLVPGWHSCMLLVLSSTWSSEHEIWWGRTWGSHLISFSQPHDKRHRMHNMEWHDSESVFTMTMEKSQAARRQKKLRSKHSDIKYFDENSELLGLKIN